MADVGYAFCDGRLYMAEHALLQACAVMDDKIRILELRGLLCRDTE
jgi:hypothetical protein